MLIAILIWAGAILLGFVALVVVLLVILALVLAESVCPNTTDWVYRDRDP